MFKVFKEQYPHFADVVAQANAIAKKIGIYHDAINHPTGQIAVQHFKPDVDDCFIGLGTVSKKSQDWENIFTYIQPSFKGTAIADYLEWLAVPVYRTRIMLSRPKSCYSIHSDFSPRLHLPLITNKQCNFVFTNPASLIHMPADGQTYWVDTRHEHTFMNGSIENRLHLVMIVKE
jgi:hypothetical protein